MNFRPHWSYFKYLVRHKLGVLRECWKFGLFWQGIVHDLSKFSSGEWFAYVHHFYDENGTQKPFEHQQDTTFDFAWNLHIHRNPHHWQYWILLQDDGVTKALPVPEKARQEMLADWLSFGGFEHTKEWYARNHGKMILHPETRKWIEEQLEIGKEAVGRYQRPVIGRYKRTRRTKR